MNMIQRRQAIRQFSKARATLIQEVIGETGTNDDGYLFDLEPVSDGYCVYRFGSEDPGHLIGFLSDDGHIAKTHPDCPETLVFRLYYEGE